MGLKFWNYNYVDQAQTVITPSTENALYPASNLKNPKRTKAFRSTGASVNVIFDLVNAQVVNSIVLAPHTKNGWGLNTPITIEASSSNVWTAPAFSTTLTSADLDNTFEVAIKEFSDQTYRFWRLSFTGTSYVEVAYLFIGAVQEIGVLTRSMDYGWQYLQDDISQVSENRYGQRSVDVIISKKRMIFDINLMSNDELDDFFEVYDYNKRSRPFFMKIESPTAISDDDRLSGLFYFDAMPTITNPSHALWNTSAQISECT